MKLKFKVACAAALAVTVLPALALQLGDVQVRSALNQPLVAAIPLHPKNLTELDGLRVSLAPAEDFARAGLKITPTDQTLQFRVVTDNNGQKLILVTSSQPVTDPYLDFLVQVNTRDGRQVREFVVLLNPVIAAPAPEVQPATGPQASPPPQQAAELPPSSQFPQPQVPQQAAPAQPVPKPAPEPAPSAPTQPAYLPTKIDVQRGDTLSGIAHDMVQGSDVNLDQMMLALKAANPDAFFKDNINNLKAGAILRIPTRELIDQRSVAAAAAEVRRQNESWRAARPHPATVVEGTAAQVAANAAPQAASGAPTSDHLTLVPPTGEGGGANNRPGVAGGTGKATVAGLRQQLQGSRDTLVSLKQSNADLQSRVESLEDISAKSDKLLSLKDSTIADLQRKLAAMHAGSAPVASMAAASARPSAPAAHKPSAATPVRNTTTPWYMQPWTWIVATLVVLALVVLGVLGRRRGAAAAGSARGPLADPEDVSPHTPAPEAPEAVPEAAGGGEVSADAAEPAGSVEPGPASEPEPAADAVMTDIGQDDASVAAASPEPAPAATPLPALPPSVAPLAALPPDEDEYVDDPVDTKLDLARAYLDMDDADSARAMLEEVLEEGTQVQKDEARRLLAGVEG
jgi:pilus assembly protein FimV